MISKNVKLQDVIIRDLYNKFGDFIENIKEMIRFYSVIELYSFFHKMLYENASLIKRESKAEGRILTDKEVKEKISKAKLKVRNLYKQREKTAILNFLQFTPYMYRISSTRATPIEHPQYDSSKDMVEQLANPLFKLVENIFGKE